MMTVPSNLSNSWGWGEPQTSIVAHDCGYPLSRYTCRATRVAADFLDFRAFCRCSTSVALHPLKILVSHLSPPPFPGGVAPKFGSEKVSRYTGVSQLQLRVSRYTVQLSRRPANTTEWHLRPGSVQSRPRTSSCPFSGSRKSPDLPFLFFLGKGQGKPPKSKDSLSLSLSSEPLNILGKKGKTLKKARNSPPKKKRKNPRRKKKQGKEA